MKTRASYAQVESYADILAESYKHSPELFAYELSYLLDAFGVKIDNHIPGQIMGARLSKLPPPPWPRIRISNLFPKK